MTASVLAVLPAAAATILTAAKLLSAKSARPAGARHGVGARVRVPRHARGRGLLLRRQHVLLSRTVARAIAATFLEVLRAVSSASTACQMKSNSRLESRGRGKLRLKSCCYQRRVDSAR